MGSSVNRYGYDVRLKAYNKAIYGTGDFSVSGTPGAVSNERRRYEERCREVYGDRYDELVRHESKDPRVVALLLDDAVRTGKRKELPDELQAEYHRRIGAQA